MALVSYWNGIAHVVLRVKLRDTTKTDNSGKTGLTFATAGLIISTIADNEAAATAYTSAGSTIETIATLGTFAAPTATKCRFKEVDATNHAGTYEIQIADARWAVSGARSIQVTVSGVSGCTQEDHIIQLPSVNLADTTNSAVATLPNFLVEAAGGIAPNFFFMDLLKLLLAMSGGNHPNPALGSTTFHSQNPAGTKNRVTVTISAIDGGSTVTAWDMS